MLFIPLDRLPWIGEEQVRERAKHKLSAFGGGCQLLCSTMEFYLLARGLVLPASLVRGWVGGGWLEKMNSATEAVIA